MVKPSEESVKLAGKNDFRLKGIRRRKWGKWVSEIRLPNRREKIWLGSYDTPEKAARAFDAAAFCLRGPTAKFNFPVNLPEIRDGSFLSPAEIQAVAAKYANEGSSAGENQQEEEQRAQESLPVSDDFVNGLDSGLDWSFLKLVAGDSGENRPDSAYPSSGFNKFVAGDDFPAVDLGEELELHQELSSLWNF